MLLALQNSQPFIVVPVPAPVHQTSLADVILSALGLTGALVLLSLVLGAGVGLLLYLWHRRHRPEDDRLPPVSPLVPGPAPRE